MSLSRMVAAAVYAAFALDLPLDDVGAAGAVCDRSRDLAGADSVLAWEFVKKGCILLEDS